MQREIKVLGKGKELEEQTGWGNSGTERQMS